MKRTKEISDFDAVLAMLAVLAIVLLAGSWLFPAKADAPAHALRDWQASRVVRSHAKLQQRPDFRVVRIVRLTSQSVRVCWSEPGYLLPGDGRDFGCDVVVLRGGRFFLKDDSIADGVWMRWL